MMKNLIIGLIVFSSLSCNSEGFYYRMKNNKKKYTEFFKYDGNKENIKLLNKDLENSNEIIIISSYAHPQSFNFIYDVTKDKYYYIEKNQVYNEILNKELKKDDIANDNVNYEDFLFFLKYVLDNKIDELIDISEKSYDDKSGVYCVVKIINIDKKTYKEFSFRSFLTFEGKPVMSESEYLKAMDFE
jgi:hypothetical protein